MLMPRRSISAAAYRMIEEILVGEANDRRLYLRKTLHRERVAPRLPLLPDPQHGRLLYGDGLVDTLVGGFGAFVAALGIPDG